MPEKLTTTRRAWLAIPALVAALAFVPAAHAAPSTDTFTGLCQIKGTSIVSDPNTGPLLEGERELIQAEGVCSGILNNAPVSSVPVRVTGNAVGNEVYYTGDGTISFIGQTAQIGFAFQQAGVATLLLQGDAGGIGEGLAAPIGEEQDQGNSHRTAFEATLLMEALSG